MPGPAQIAENAAQAAAAGDRTRFQRWIKHPRWDPTHETVGRIVQGCLSHANALEWMKELEEAGVPTQSRYGSRSICALATEALRAEVVEWLLKQGRPLPWGQGGVSPLVLLIKGVSGAENRADRVVSAHRIASAFFDEAKGFQALVGLNLETIAEVGVHADAACVWEGLALAGWNALDPDAETTAFLERVAQIEKAKPPGLGQLTLQDALAGARSICRERSLAAALPLAQPSAPKPRF